MKQEVEWHDINRRVMHTPTPYYLSEFDKRHIYSESQGYIAQAIQLDFQGTEAERDAETLANAAFLVRAANSHAALVAAAKEAVQAFRGYGFDCPAAWPSALEAANKCRDALKAVEEIQSPSRD